MIGQYLSSTIGSVGGVNSKAWWSEHKYVKMRNFEF